MEHASTFLDLATSEPIRSESALAENQKRLTEKQLELIYKNQWFNFFVPKKLGGLELSLIESLKIEEGLAWADGSTAWVVTLCSGAGWFAGFMDQTLAKEIFSDMRACCCGSGMSTGTANKIDNHYEINGSWKYASGSKHATVFTANCVMLEDGRPMVGDVGSSLIGSFVMKKDEVKILETWSAMGMMATGSHSFTAAKLQVGEERLFIIKPSHATLPNPIFKYPFLQLAETTLTVNLSGMTARFLELCRPVFKEKMKQKVSYRNSFPDLISLINEAEAQLDAKRTVFYDAVDRSASSKMMNDVSKASHDLADASRKMVRELFPYCGLTAADTSLEINRVWRNISTAGQHALFNF